MKKLLFILLLLICGLAQSQNPYTTQFKDADSKKTLITGSLKTSDVNPGNEMVMVKIDTTDEEYGRAFIIIQSSSEPSPELKTWLINIPGQLWKKYRIVPYISIQIGIPSSPCGNPPKRPC